MVKLWPDSVIKLSHLCYIQSIENRKSQNYVFFLFPTKCLQSAMLRVASTGILWHCHISRNSAHKTELLLPMRELPEECLLFTHFNPRTPILTTSHPKKIQSPKLPSPHTVSLGSVLFARKQHQWQDLKARATHTSVSAWLSPGHLSHHAGVAPYWGKQLLAMPADDIPAGGTRWFQRWPWVFP